MAAKPKKPTSPPPPERDEVGYTLEERTELVEKLCEHLRGCRSVESFAPASPEVVRHLAALHPLEFLPVKCAFRVGRSKMESEGLAGLSGKRPRFNHRAWEVAMVNLYRWTGTGQPGAERHWIEELPEPGLPTPTAAGTEAEAGAEPERGIVYEFRLATPEDVADADSV